jgi:hypothetical protein
MCANWGKVGGRRGVEMVRTKKENKRYQSKKEKHHVLRTIYSTQRLPNYRPRIRLTTNRGNAIMLSFSIMCIRLKSQKCNLCTTADTSLSLETHTALRNHKDILRLKYCYQSKK